MLELLQSLGLENYLDNVAMYVLMTRAFFKPACSFYMKYITPYISINFTDKTLNSPIYKGITYLIDWSSSVKLPKAKND